MSRPPDDFLAFLEAQRQEYRRGLPQRMASVDRFWQQIEAGEAAVGLAAELEREAHNLAGSGATFGFAGVSRAARELENAVQSGDRGRMRNAIAALRSSLPPLD